MEDLFEGEFMGIAYCIIKSIGKFPQWYFGHDIFDIYSKNNMTKGE